MKKSLLFIALVSLLFSCSQQEEKKVEIDPASVEYMHQLAKSMNDIIVYDIFSPPVASRIYAYSTLAAYESARWMDTTHPSLTAQLKGFGAMPKPEEGKQYDFRISAVKAFFVIAQKLTFTKDSSNSVESRMLQELGKLSNETIYERSVDFGLKIADSILSRAGSCQWPPRHWQ